MFGCWIERRISTSARSICSRSEERLDDGFFSTLTATFPPGLSRHAGKPFLHSASSTLANDPVPSLRPSL